ncbi:MAG: alpha/beta hydrolase [Parvularculaceae bacterium]|nr:alpha/beta hydrolase [Parvularculaceae bacterium]
MRRMIAGAAGFLAVLGLAFLALRTPDTNREDMVAKYGGPDATFADGAGGMRVHWRDQGCRDCPAIILLHGSNASLHTFEAMIADLAGEYRIITYDQPGHGLTGPHPRDDYSAAGMFEALNAVANAARLDRFFLGGNSMGGWVAWRYALAYPERVEGLVLIDAAGAPLRDGETAPPLNVGFRLLRNPMLRPLIRQITPRSLVGKSLKESVADPAIVTEAMVDRYWELLRFPGNRRASAIRAMAPREPEYFERIAEITAPSLLLWGAKDTLIYASAATTFDGRLPNADVVILDNVGHLPMEEAPAATANAIRRFLEGLQPEAVDTLKLEQPQ